MNMQFDAEGLPLDERESAIIADLQQIETSAR